MGRVQRTMVGLTLAGLGVFGAAAQEADKPKQGLGPITVQTPVDLKMIQDAWRTPEANVGPGQQRPGYRYFVYESGATYVVHGRLGIVTTIIIDERDRIGQDGIVNGNPGALMTAQKSANTVLVQPTKIGIDTSLDIHADGYVYQFQVISEALNVDWVTDRRVDVVRRRSPTPATMSGGAQGRRDDRTAGARSRTGANTIERLAARGVEGINDDRAYGNEMSVEFDPGSVESAVAIGLGTEGSEQIAPVRAWRDREWTFLDYGEKAKGMSAWPAVMRLVGRVERPFNNTTTAGSYEQVLVIKGRGDFVLRSGQMVVCIIFKEEAKGPGAGTSDAISRNAAVHESGPATRVSEIAQDWVTVEMSGGREGVKAMLTGLAGAKARELKNVNAVQVTGVDLQGALKLCERAQRDRRTCSIVR